MVRHALSLRRGSALELEIDTTVNAIGGSTNSSGAPIRRGSRRESLPLSRHHQLRRSSSVSTRTRTNSSSTGSLSSLGDGDSAMRESPLDDELAVIVDDNDDELEAGLQTRPGRRKLVIGTNEESRGDGKQIQQHGDSGRKEDAGTKAEI